MSRLVLCGVVSWLALGPAAPVRGDDAEDKAVALVEGLGGKVTRDGKRPGKPVTEVDLSGTAVTDAELPGLAPLKNLTGAHWPPASSIQGSCGGAAAESGRASTRS